MADSTSDRHGCCCCCERFSYRKMCEAFSVSLSKTSGASGATKYQSHVITTDGVAFSGQLLGSNNDRVGIIVFSLFEDFLTLDTEPITDFLLGKVGIVSPETLLVLKQDDWGPLLQSSWFWTQDAPAVLEFTVTEILL